MAVYCNSLVVHKIIRYLALLLHEANGHMQC
jgi:hypothetical protein